MPTTTACRRRSDIPDHLANVIELAIAHSPDERYPTADDFRSDIQRTFADSTQAEQSDTPRGLLSPIATVLAAPTSVELQPNFIAAAASSVSSAA